ncbi:LacI family DNA-binding transcriptional regulator [Tropicimonas sp. TH_r6]|uniref:LacI family DNA-binding transcriptional regulator n=1 Tax=Tropicimonas sp. TH_r6 TaxID=3082085 RepID=UPI002953B51F|nr:LacI family DNA-binding transcriptional regulator [Tropicimonas sp. TH_r6]MDV7143396.1 LacI family DNA-binding transcriptional regulator [Tropicimonas sp. TH_r6]
MVSIKHVAQAAGVSVSTVSHVINKTRFVAPDTRAAVEKAVKDLDYQPSYLARALKSKRTHTLGMLVTSSTNPFFAEIVSGVEEGCYRAGYSLILCNAGDQPGRQRAYLQTLMQKRIDALVVMTTNRDPEFQEDLARLNTLPRAVLDSEPMPNACAIGDDSLLGGRLAGEALIQRGHDRIGCLTGPVNHPRSHDRLEGFEQAMSEAGLELDPDLIVTGDLSAHGGYEAMVELLDRAAPPSAVFAFNDLMAMGAYRAITERGLRIPEDISVIGYDDLEIASYLYPALTTIRQPGFGLGLEAAEILIGHLERGEELPALIRKLPELVARDSLR